MSVLFYLNTFALFLENNEMRVIMRNGSRKLFSIELSCVHVNFPEVVECEIFVFLNTLHYLREHLVFLSLSCTCE